MRPTQVQTTTPAEVQDDVAHRHTPLRMSKRVRDEDSLASSSSPELDMATTNISTARRRTESTSSQAHARKYAPVQLTSLPPVMHCTLPPHKPLPFSSYSHYESHYETAHTNRCTTCHANFPTPHLLHLHISEHHDPIIAVKRSVGDEKTYACFVEGCEKVCADWKKRRSHLVDKHAFPKNYDFLVVQTGIDGKRSMLRAGVDAQGHRKSSRERFGDGESSTSDITSERTEVSSVIEQPQRVATASSEEAKEYESKAEQEKVDVEQITISMSSLKMVPRSITFGRHRGRSGFAQS